MLVTMLKSSLTLACCAAAVAACAHAPATVATPASNGPDAPTQPALSETVLRSYLELVRNAAQRDGKSEQTSDCLLQSTPGGAQFRGQVAVGIRPLPLPSVDLDP